MSDFTNFSPTNWPKAILMIDMNAFFAAVEQLDHPEWCGQPIAVTNGAQGTCIITCSYEARAYGIKTGMRLQQAYQLCSQLIRCPSRPKRYSEVSKKIMATLANITPDLEIFSVDEAFLDVTRCQRLYGTPVQIGKMVREQVLRASGLLCSIGISGDKTTAKYAAKCQKPNGFTVIPPWQAQQTLQAVPVTELCGIGNGIARFLARYGVIRCGDMAKLPISVLAQRFGNIGRRIWYMCQGADPDPVHTTIGAPKSMGHGKVMPPNTTDRATILTYLQHMAQKLAARLRRHQLAAQHFFIGLRNRCFGWLGEKIKVVMPTNDGNTLFKLCCEVLHKHWQGEPVDQVQVTALDPQPIDQQLDFFVNNKEETTEANAMIDSINSRYGEFAIAPARLLLRSKMHNVIAPAWKPSGHRQTID